MHMFQMVNQLWNVWTSAEILALLATFLTFIFSRGIYCWEVNVSLARMEFPIFVHCQYLFCRFHFYFLTYPTTHYYETEFRRWWETKHIGPHIGPFEVKKSELPKKIFREYSVAVRGNSPPIFQAGRKVVPSLAGLRRLILKLIVKCSIYFEGKVSFVPISLWYM